jgi:hypothetical protein
MSRRLGESRFTPVPRRPDSGIDQRHVHRGFDWEAAGLQITTKRASEVAGSLGVSATVGPVEDQPAAPPNTMPQMVETPTNETAR